MRPKIVLFERVGSSKVLKSHASAEGESRKNISVLVACIQGKTPKIPLHFFHKVNKKRASNERQVAYDRKAKLHRNLALKKELPF